MVFLTPLIYGQDLSGYRQFQFGADLPSIAKQTGMKPSEATTIHERPALIQELEWQSSYLYATSPALKSDSARSLLFSFYNGHLFRIVVNYDRYKTEGLTDADMIEAVSLKYGTATRPATAKSISLFSSQIYSDSQHVIAYWEDAQYAFNLFRSSYEPTFGMVVVSKSLDALARTAIVEAVQLDVQEAPRRELERHKKQEEENRVAQEKARLANKAVFRP
jgi:hypothetical protein